WNMQQTGVGPHAIVGFDLVEVVEQQRLDRATETVRCHARHLRRSVGWVNVKPPDEHFRRSGTRSASELQDCCRGLEQREKAGQPRMCRDLALGIGLGVAAIKPKGSLVHSPSCHETSAICSSPAASGKPNIKFMFWIA